MDAQRVRRQLDRILASAAFAEAERAKSLLRFVVERTLEGHIGEIKESVIALEALDRHSSFDSKSDPIVRVEAGRLRDRLSSYYDAEGDDDPVLISLPKGRYVPEFTERRPRETPKAAGEAGRLRDRLSADYEAEGEADPGFDLSAEGALCARVHGAAACSRIGVAMAGNSSTWGWMEP